MTRPALSIVVPVLNEERCIGDFLRRVSDFLVSREQSWEVIVVDDGSTDGTVAAVARWTVDSRIRLLKESHRGKGAAVRRGMLAATGAWRLMTDADLSVPPDEWGNVLDIAAAGDAQVIVGSREAAGARRIGEPLVRHLIGRVFNWVVQAAAVPGVNDTQCGFKLIRGDAAETVFPHMTTDGFAFDVELLFLARRAGYRIREVGVIWICRRDSRVRISRGAAAFVHVLNIPLKAWRGRYDSVRVGSAVAPAGDQDVAATHRSSS